MPEDPYETPEEMMFDSNLDEFATKVGFIVGLESNGKVSAEDAYQRIRKLWRGLKKSRKNLGIKPGVEGDSNEDSAS